MNSKLAESGNWKDSGMQLFVNDMEAFLTSSDKAKEMIRPVVNQSLDIINREITKTEGLVNALSFSPEDFDQRVRNSLPKLEKAKSTQKDINRYIDDRTHNIALKYENYATDVLQEFSLNVKNKIVLFEGNAEELKDSLPQDIKSELTQVLIDIQEYTNGELGKLRDEVSRRYEYLCNDIETVKNDISSTKSLSLSTKSIATLRSSKDTGYAFEDLL